MNDDSVPRKGSVTVDDHGYVFVGCVKVLRIAGNKVEAYDKNRHRSRRAGSPCIQVLASEFIRVIQVNTVGEGSDG